MGTVDRPFRPSFANRLWIGTLLPKAIDCVALRLWLDVRKPKLAGLLPRQRLAGLLPRLRLLKRSLQSSLHNDDVSGSDGHPDRPLCHLHGDAWFPQATHPPAQAARSQRVRYTEGEWPESGEEGMWIQIRR